MYNWEYNSDETNDPKSLVGKWKSSSPFCPHCSSADKVIHIIDISLIDEWSRERVLVWLNRGGQLDDEKMVVDGGKG